MDNIILGLLLLESRTIYQLRERIRKGMDLMYSSSMGSIQAAIKNCWIMGISVMKKVWKTENTRKSIYYNG